MAAVSQNGAPISAQVTNINSTNYVLFDVVPNGGDVVLTKTAPPPALSNPAFDLTPEFNFQLNGLAGLSYVIYSSSNLLDWLPLQTNTLSGASTNLTFPAPDAAQFYRARWLP